MSFEKYDLIIAGAGYAGLACAVEAAKRGLKTLVIDKKKFAGQNPHTTGIIVKEAEEKWFFPKEHTKPLTNVKIFSPSMRSLDLYSPGYFFLAADTPAILRWMAQKAEEAGAELMWNSPLKSVEIEGEWVKLPEYKVRSRFLAGADGPRSKTARIFSLDQNRKFLYGAEAEFSYSVLPSLEQNSMYCFLDAKIAPGYLAWIVPGKDAVQVGMAVHKAKYLSMNTLFQKLKPFGVNPRDIIFKKGGLIPAGGPLKNISKKNVLLLGDAAGIVSPLTAGGIHTALESGKRGGALIAEYLQNKSEHPAVLLQKELPGFFWKKRLRFLMETVPANWMYNLALSTPLFRKFARVIYFHNRGLFSKEAWKDLIGIK